MRDPRDRVIDAALEWTRTEETIRTLSRIMRSLTCLRGPAEDCAVPLRHQVRQDRSRRRTALLRATQAFGNTIYGAAKGASE